MYGTSVSTLDVRCIYCRFQDQAGAANATLDKGLYIGLRLDGRVRASGSGIPPWQIFAAQLAPMEGMWKGVFDGMDGRVGG